MLHWYDLGFQWCPHLVPIRQVYEHHCINKLPGSVRRFRDAAVYMVNNIDAVQWALEFFGFRNVGIKVGVPMSPAMLSA
jgi:hypothetical protein